MPRLFGNNKLISDSSIKRWIVSVNSPSSDLQNTQRSTGISKRPFIPELPDDHILDAAYAETRSFVDNFIRRDELADIADELHFFDEYDKTITSDLQYDVNGIPKLSSLPQPPSPPPVDYDQPDDKIVNSIIEKLLEKPIFPRELYDAGLVDDLSSEIPIITGESRQLRQNRLSSRSSSTVANQTARTADFLARMKVRQEIVKQNREKKEAEERARKREEVAKREVLAEAKRRAAIEQKEREIKEKAEEEEIKKDMMKIKQQMESQRKLITKLNSQKRAVTEAAEAAARAELDLEVTKKQEVEEEVRVAMEEQQRLKLVRLEQIMKSRQVENVKLLQRCFKSWYNMILEDRLSAARFRAVADWRRIVRAWNRWRSRTSQRIAERAAKQHADELRSDFRRENMADTHYKRRIMLSCIREWCSFVERQKETKLAEAAKEERKAKMASFLAAATATAVVAQNMPQVESFAVCDPIISRGIDELFSTPQKGLKLDLKQLSSDEEEKHVIPSGGGSRGRGKPISRKYDRKVSSAGNRRTTQKPSNNANMDNLSSSQSEQEGDPLTENLRLSPDRKAVRQQQVINLQRERIRDQQMLIKELSYARRQSEMVQQISKYEELLRGLEQLTKMASKKPPSAREAKTTSNRVLSSELPAVDSSPKKEKEPDGVKANENDTTANNNNNRSEYVNVQPVADNGQVVADSAVANDASSRTDVMQLQLNEVVQLFQAAKNSPAFQPPTPSTAQYSSNRRIKSACSSTESEFTKKMEERAEMRRRTKEEREKKKQEVEQQRIEEERQREEEQKQKEEEEKRAKVEELKRKRQLEKEREEQRQAQLQREQELLVKAADANLKRLMRHCAWLPWRRLIEQQRKRWQAAVECDSFNTQRRFLIAWADFNRTDLAERNSRANSFFQRLIVRRCFESWRKYGNYMLILEQKANRHYRAVLLVEAFNKWDRFVDHQRRKEIRDEDAAEMHNLRRMMRFVFRAWRKIPLMAREERDRIKRLENMRRRVAQILPDFNPSSATTSTPPPQQSIDSSLMQNALKE